MCNCQIINNFGFKINQDNTLKEQRLVRNVGKTLKHLTKISKHTQNFFMYEGHISN